MTVRPLNRGIYKGACPLVRSDIGAHRFNTILRRTQDCVDIACTGAIK
jgi:hypothetical protein